MDPFAEDFDAFFSHISGSSSSTLGTSTKGDRPLVVPSAKGKLPDSFFGALLHTKTSESESVLEIPCLRYLHQKT